MNCATYQRWFSPYVDERLALEERAQLEHHLTECARCRNGLDALQQMLRSLRAMEPPETPELLPGIQARLTREPWWQRLARRFVAPWPTSLPLHGAALATTAFLVIVVVGTQRPMKSLGDRKEQRADEVGQAIDVSTRSTVEERQSDVTARRSLANQAVAYEPYYDEHPTVQWQVSDLASAAAQLNGWVQSKGGSVTTIDEHRLSVTLPEASVSEFLTQFSSSVSAPATISLDAPPDSTRWVTISLELISPE